MNNKGFTLIEIIAVIVIIGIIAIVATVTVSGVMQNSKKKLNEDMIKTIKDSAITYAIDKLNIVACDSNNITSSCARTFTVSELIELGYFVDDGNDCKKSNSVTIKKIKTGNNYSYEVSLDENTCMGG